MVKEPKTASLLHIFVTWLTFFTFMMLQRWVSRLLFLRLMKPLVPISRGRLEHLKPLPSIVVLRSLYLSVFLCKAAPMLAEESQGTVSSTSITSGGLAFLFTITRSGFYAVMATSGGMVTPLILFPSKSAYSSRPSNPWEANSFKRKWTMLLWRHSYLSRASLQLLRR